VVPSPHMATAALGCSSRMSLNFLGRGLGEEVVDAGFGGNGRGRHRIVAGDHHGAVPSGAFREALPNAALEMSSNDEAEQLAVADHRQRGSALLPILRDGLDSRADADSSKAVARITPPGVPVSGKAST